MNEIKPHIAERLKAMLIAGESTRTIMREIGVAKNTVIRHRDLLGALGAAACKCGKRATHQGWCAYRLSRSPARQRFMVQLRRPDGERACTDCGGPISYGAGLRCKECYEIRAEKAREEKANRMVPCKICCALTKRNAKGSFDWHCPTEWCQRLFSFYYVEGRSRPPSVQDARNNGLSFEIFLSDYIRRNAREIQSGSQHGRTSGRAVRRVGISA